MEGFFLLAVAGAVRVHAHPKRGDVAAICAPRKGAYERIQPFSKRLVFETDVYRYLATTKDKLRKTNLIRQLKLLSNKRDKKNKIPQNRD